MRFIDLTTKYHLTQDKIKIAISTVSIILVSAIALIGVKTLLDTEAKAEVQRRQDEAAGLLVGAGETTTTDAEIVRERDDVGLATTDETSEETDETTDETTDESLDETSEEDSSSSEETAAATTTAEQTTTTTTAGISETPLYMTVFASQSLNLRTGPGTEYSLVRTLNAGDAIDVVASTSNGWYRTYNGNYVLASYTQSTPPATQATTAATTAATAAQTAATTTAARAPSGSTNNCTITFYGPQPRGDGTYSVTTATGTTCSQGRTCAADWSIYPAGTVIYIENDPLGGDGYYTVEDRGPGVRGYHIDIYVDDVSGWNTTSRNVSVG